MSASDGVGGLDRWILNALIKRCLYKQFQLEHIQLTPFFSYYKFSFSTPGIKYPPAPFLS